MKKIFFIFILVFTLTACNNTGSDIDNVTLEFSDNQEGIDEMFISKDFYDMDQDFEDGEYTGETIGEADSKLVVKTIIKDGKISEVNIVKQKETPGISDKTLEDIPRRIIDKNSVNSIDMYAGATHTGERIIDAVVKCLDQAIKK